MSENERSSSQHHSVESEDSSTGSEKTYEFDGEEVEKVYESNRGDYWVITDDSGTHPFGYACLASMRQFAEWGTINKDNLTGPMVWEVPQENWTVAGPSKINIKRTD